MKKLVIIVKTVLCLLVLVAIIPLTWSNSKGVVQASISNINIQIKHFEMRPEYWVYMTLACMAMLLISVYFYFKPRPSKPIFLGDPRYQKYATDSRNEVIPERRVVRCEALDWKPKFFSIINKPTEKPKPETATSYEKIIRGRIPLLNDERQEREEQAESYYILA